MEEYKMKDKQKWIQTLVKDLKGSILTVTCVVRQRILASEPIVKIYTKDIQDLLSEEYIIINIIEDTRISNSGRKYNKKTGVWKFEVKRKRKKTIIQNKKETKSKFSDRIKSIATEKEKEYSK